MSKEISKLNNIAAWIISGALTALFLFSAYGKFAQPENMVQMNLADWSVIIPIGEIIAALLFLLPRTNLFGTLLLSSYMGGAIIIHMTTAQSIIVPSVVLILVWVVAILRNPIYIKSLKG